VRAGELLGRSEASTHRVGPLTMGEPPHAVAGRWCCWLFGEPRDRGTLGVDYGLEPHGDLAAAFGRALAEREEQAYELLWGRFAIVALDRERDRCVLTRDQLGAQPLVYTSVADGVVFAEHERELLGVLTHTPAPDRLALLQWIDNGLRPAQRTLYERLHCLPAGHRLVLENRRAHAERWWHARYHGVEGAPRAQLAAHVRDAALAAVGRAAGGCGRPAVKLSGGLDSACVAAGLAANGLADGRALALGGSFTDYPETDESALMEATARHTQLELERIAFDPSSSMLAPALEHIARWRLPPDTPNLFLWQPLMARARELGVDLMLDGEGGDELFGLAPYLIGDRLRSGRLRSAWTLTGRIPGNGANPGSRTRLRALRRFGVSPLVPSSIRSWRQIHMGSTPAGAIVPRADARTLAELDSQAKHAAGDGPLWWRFQADTVIDLRDSLGMGAHYRRLAADDRLERSHPFLHDLQLIEAMLRVPPQAQFDPVRDRVLLREGLHGLIPEAVRSRHEKSHFTPLVLAGIRADEDGLVAPLQRTDAPVRAYVDADALARKLATAAERRPMLQAGSLWRIGIANRWLLSQEAEGQ
jgi:asparagine synthase (glutamine-hydrolysing)